MLIAAANQHRRIGAEFEFTLPLLGTGSSHDARKVLADILTQDGIWAVVRPYSNAPVPAEFDLAIETDSSVRGESRYRGITWFPVEIKTRILKATNDWEHIVPKTLDICRYLGARTNRTTSHHLHVEFLEARNEPKHIRSLYNLIHRHEPHQVQATIDQEQQARIPVHPARPC